MNDVKLNLARKWRSKNFDQIVGQDVSVRMLKNSLYRDHYFPVYLFSGQRGCGKTSTARVFASAINCEQLSAFQKDPKSTSIPCLNCASCVAMAAGNHPDFIEMDAASHTGVDNVRQIVESSTLLPVMGRKKIYLIDEAHMLSKAAFNAFLKILEEPPASVLFILATTDTDKIIDTVKSRCFQLFFRLIEHEALVHHLEQVCAAESIAADRDALDIIIKETGGSARDALNLLEQVRFSSARVSKDTVLTVLGHVDDQRIVELLRTVIEAGPAEVLRSLQKMSFEESSAEFMWRRLIDLVRALIWVKHDLKPLAFGEHSALLRLIAQKCSWNRLRAMLSMLCLQEQSFMKTTAKHTLLEMILLQLSVKNSGNDSDEGPAGVSSAPQQPDIATDGGVELDEQGDDQDDDEEIIQDEEEGAARLWQLFLKKVEQLNDPVVLSVFKNGLFVAFDAQAKRLDVSFPKKFLFFKDSLDAAAHLWQPLLHTVFQGTVAFEPNFNHENPAAPERPRHTMPAVEQSVKKTSTQFTGSAKKMTSSFGPRNAPSQAAREMSGPVVDTSDAQMWPKAQLLLEYFPGRITQVRE